MQERNNLIKLKLYYNKEPTRWLLEPNDTDPKGNNL